MVECQLDGKLRTICVGFFGKQAQEAIFQRNWGTFKFITSTFGFYDEWKICANISQLLFDMIVVVSQGIYCIHSNIIFPYSFVFNVFRFRFNSKEFNLLLIRNNNNKLNEIMNQSCVGSTPHYLDMSNGIAFRTIYISFARFYSRIYMFFRFLERTATTQTD